MASFARASVEASPIVSGQHEVKHDAEVPASASAVPSPSSAQSPGSQALNFLKDVAATPVGAAEMASAKAEAATSTTVHPTAMWHQGSDTDVAKLQTPGEDTFADDGDITKQDHERIQTALDKAKELLGDKPFLLHVGAGVGNPMNAIKNPSAGRLQKAGSEAQDPKAQSQREPGYLQQAGKHGLVAVVLNFNASDAKGHESGVTVAKHEPNVIRLDVDARFPLKVLGTGNAGKAHKAIQDFASTAKKVAILNAIHRTYYPGMKALFDSQNTRKLLEQDGPPTEMRASYIESYLETDHTQVYSQPWWTKGKSAVTREDQNTRSILDKWDDVFPTMETAFDPPKLK